MTQTRSQYVLHRRPSHAGFYQMPARANALSWRY
jgi:hypothetical protein